MNKLTSKQQYVLEAVRTMVNERRENPTAYRLHKYLMTAGHEESLKGVVQVVESLEKKELIQRDHEKRIFLVENHNYANLNNIFSVPLYGLASCGEALAYAQDNVDGYLQISKSLFRDAEPAKLFAVKALGDSMDLDNIQDGDYVIFEKYEGQCELEGKIVVAVINGLATIKRYRNVGGGVIGLFPYSRNKAHQPIYIHSSDSVLIAGIFRRVLPVRFVSL